MQDFVFKKKFGQNFISDANLLNAIAADANVQKTDEVLEIGAGAGSLTSILSSRAKKVVSFEIDTDLQKPLLDLNLPNVNFVFGDFMDADLAKVEDMFEGRYKVVANLPYYITTPIIFKLLENAQKLQSFTIMVQKEVALRAVATPKGDYGILSVMVNFYGDAKLTRTIGRQMFYPQPNVDSALLNIVVYDKFPGVDKAGFLQYVKAAFAMRRKTLFNNLSAFYAQKGVTKDQLLQIFGEKTLKMRTEQFCVEELVEQYKKLCNNLKNKTI